VTTNHPGGDLRGTAIASLGGSRGDYGSRGERGLSARGSGWGVEMAFGSSGAAEAESVDDRVLSFRQEVAWHAGRWVVDASVRRRAPGDAGIIESVS
jgi:hypothetical protein